MHQVFRRTLHTETCGRPSEVPHEFITFQTTT